jgi:predicted nucleic acid-binding protein
MSWLLDTCALSEYIKKAPDLRVIDWLDQQNEIELYVSALSLGEIEKGILKLQASDAGRANKLRLWLDKLKARFSGRILSLDAPVFATWARLAAQAELAGRPMPVMDGLLIATAHQHGLTVVTRNERDFAGHAPVFNPWLR